MSKTEKKSPASAAAEDNFFAAEEAPLPRSQRPPVLSLLLSGMVLVLGVVWLITIREDLSYFFRGQQATDLGLADKLEKKPLGHNDYVRIEGIARDMCIRAELLADTVKYFYLLGSEMGSRILIEVAGAEDDSCLGAVDRVFQGRLLNLADNQRYARVLSYYREHFPAAPATGEIYLLQDGHPPRSAWWVPLATLAILIMWGLHVWMLWRRRRPRIVPDDLSEGDLS